MRSILLQTVEIFVGNPENTFHKKLLFLKESKKNFVTLKIKAFDVPALSFPLIRLSLSYVHNLRKFLYLNVTETGGWVGGGKGNAVGH